ncbi:MAG: prepilin-type N-terminal cleavage/methylation domain-containing protein [Legionellales bacterium]|nr:prepilin-type N-terminal cleavage/methylation domain-containing protein [Legionellales bacterium]
MYLFFDDKKGFTLIELISIIIILGIIAAVAIPRYYSYKSNAELTVVKATLSNVRTAINNFYLHKVVEEGEGRYPTIDEINTAGVILKEGIPENPYNGVSSVGETDIRNVKYTDTVGWGYHSLSGTFWINNEDYSEL